MLQVVAGCLKALLILIIIYICLCMQVCVCLTNGGYFMILQNEAYSTDERNKMAIQIMKKQS